MHYGAKVLTNGKKTFQLSCALKKLSNKMFFAFHPFSTFRETSHANQSTTSSSAILTQELFISSLLSRNLSQNTSFLLTSATPGYDCRSVLKHVLKSYDIFFDVNNSRKRVVGLIYTKQFMS